MKSTAEIIRDMAPWYSEERGHKFTFPDMRADTISGRTPEQKIWDHAILAAAELIRRLGGNDNERALAIHGLLSTNLPKDGARTVPHA
jgi:hypothetical protein